MIETIMAQSTPIICRQQTQTDRGPSQLDSLAVVNITVTYQDNTTASYDSVVMFQTANGDLFLANSNFNGTDIRGPAQKKFNQPP